LFSGPKDYFNLPVVLALALSGAYKFNSVAPWCVTRSKPAPYNRVVEQCTRFGVVKRTES